MERQELGRPEDVTEAVERAYRRIAVGMAELPIYNPSLAVELVGVRRHEGEWLAVLVTPWTVSLLLAPAGAASRLRRLGADDKQVWRFPSGEYEFLGGEQPEVGFYQTCSLLSPTGALGSPEARTLAQAALTGLLMPEAGAASGAPEAASVAPEATAPASTAAVVAPPAPEPPAPPPSRRAFLTFGRRR